MKPIAVTGVSGHTGRVAAERLLARSLPVRVIVRDARKGEPWKELGAEVAVADLGDEAALKRAFDGVDGVYLLLPPKLDARDFLADRKRLVETIARALQAAVVPHVVFLSSVGAQLPSGTGPILALRHSEQVLESASASVTFLRPSFFMENWGMVLPAVKSDGVLPTFLPPERAFPQIATQDIGGVVARELLIPGRGAKHVELSGPVASPREVADAFSRLLGRTVQPEVAPLSAIVPTFTSMGVSDNVARLFAEMYGTLGSGQLVFEKPESVELMPTALIDGLRGLLASGS
ncbi:MAG TPA: NmrA family NAD(P)-binding protein [Planctomycetota bacterium]|nr:NmrA family NAD(P)-binding protein [Planctomycetota bacterium]